MIYNYDDIEIHYQKIGTSKEIIFILPGWGNTACTFKELISILEKEYTIYIIDYPGFGKSPPLTKTWSIYDYAKMICQFLNDLQIQPTLIIAHSFGGRLAILLNGYYQLEIPKILLLDSAGIRPRKTLFSILRKVSYRFCKKISCILPKQYQKKYLTFLFQKFASPDYLNLPDEMRLTFQNIVQEDLRKYLPMMTSEVLLIWGKEDQDTPIRDAYLMRKKIKKSELIVFERCGHFSYLENPYLTIKIILAFLKEESC